MSSTSKIVNQEHRSEDSNTKTTNTTIAKTTQAIKTTHTTKIRSSNKPISTLQQVTSIFDLPPADLSFKNIHNFLNSHSKRDKIGKIVHYGSRGVVGLCDNLLAFFSKTSVISTFLLITKAKFNLLYVRVMNARRTVRWLSGTGLALSIMNKELSTRVKAIKALLLTWILTDHYRWLQQLTILPGDQALTRNIGFSFACFSWALATYHHIMVLMSSKPSKNETLDDTSKRIAMNNKTKRQILRNALGAISAAHVAKLFVSSEAICGFFGSFVAALDVYDLFPRFDK
jgi:hypothetical protein